jgi:Asp-tRNA(Asn)/Glu-tRNA(Gln) amidotransferase A subunit family amidase
MTLCWTMDKLGPMCRGVEDCAVLFAAIHGPDGRDGAVVDVPFRWDPRSDLASLRVGFHAEALTILEKEPERKATFEAVLETMRRLGIALRPVSLPEQQPRHEALNTILQVEAGASFQQLVMSERIALLNGQEAWSWPTTFRVGSTVSAVDYVQLTRFRRKLQHAMADALAGIDVYVSPTNTPPNMLYTNMTGHPTVVTRCGMLDGKPLSVEFIGNLYQDAAALRVAFAYEQATEWHRQWPSL